MSPLSPFLILIYVVLAALVGVTGRNRAAGFSGFFVLSLLLTPVVTSLILLLGSPRTKPE